MIKSQIQILGFFTIDLSSLIERTSKRASDSIMNFELTELTERKQNNKQSGAEELIALMGDQNEVILEEKPEQMLKPEIIDLEINLKEKKKTKKIKKVRHKSHNLGTCLANDVKIIDYLPIFNKDRTINKDYIVIMAKYFKNSRNEIIEREVPNPNSYLSVGYDKTAEKMKENINKHYRYYVDKELEKTDFLDPYLFNEYDIMRGKRFNVNQGHLWERIFFADEAYHVINDD